MERTFEKVMWLWVRDDLARQEFVSKLYDLGYTFCKACDEWKKDVCRDCRICKDCRDK